MGCLFAMFAGFFPRLGTLVIWLARPQLFAAAFGGAWLWPLLGILFLPFTTLMYVILWSPGIGLTFWDWIWLGTAVFLDISHYAAAGYANRDRLPTYTTPAATTVATPAATIVDTPAATTTGGTDVS